MPGREHYQMKRRSPILLDENVVEIRTLAAEQQFSFLQCELVFFRFAWHTPTSFLPCPLAKMVRKSWVAARDDDERKRLRKGEEGLAVKRLPKAAPQLLKRFASPSRTASPGLGNTTMIRVDEVFLW